MVRQVLAFVLLSFALALPVEAAKKTPPPTQSQTAQLAMFATESAAQAHCPKNEVVWLNTSSRIYHEKGMRWYGSTKHGAFVCRKEADAAGYRDTRNGQ
jgi:hypothetical protein